MPFIHCTINGTCTGSRLYLVSAMVEGYGTVKGGFSVSGKAGSSNPTRTDESDPRNGNNDDERKPLLSGNHVSNEKAPSFFSSLTFAWFSPLLEIGNRNGTLEPTDIASLPLPDDCTTAACMEAFDECWADEKLRAEQRTADEIRRKRRKRRRQYQDIDVEKSPRSKDDDDDGTGTDVSDMDPHDMPSQSFFEPVTTDPIIPTQPSLARALAWAFGKEFAKAGLLKLCHDLLIFVGPYVLNQLILFLRDESAPLSRGLYLTSAVTISQLLMSFCLRHYFFRCYLVGLRARTALVVAIYRKALVLSASERQKRSAGEIVNLLSTDAQRIQSLMTYLHATWYSFVQIGLALYFLWRQLGPSCLAGVVIIVIMMPITRAVASWMGGKQKRLMNAKDERVELNNECLGSMKVLKMQAWEEPMYDRLLHLRQVELRKLYDYVVANSLSIMLWNAVPLLVALSTFAAYTLSGHTLDVASALTSLSLFEILRFPLFMLPQIINRMVEAGVSIDRIQSFLQCKEHAAPRTDEIEEDYGVRMENATLIHGSIKPDFDAASMNRHGGQANILAKQLHETQWEVALLKAQLIEADEKIRSLAIGESVETPQSSPSPLALKRISLECKPGRFIAIVGHVGSSKSSLINAILGELQLLSGTQSVKGRLALFPQTPFVMNDSLRNNITTFGKHGDEEFDATRYERAIRACALEPDLQALPGGDLTIIGEKGITLSGGQKARVACARAVYSGADIFLLDDPLAAVDAHVATHLFSDCIVKEMLYGGDSSTNRSRCSSVVLVTNAVQYLNSPEVDTIIVLREGRIADAGTFSELSARNGLFSSFLSVLADETSQAEREDLVVFSDEKEARSSPALTGARSSCSISALGDVDQPDVSKVLCPKTKLNHSPTTVHRKSLVVDKKAATNDIATSDPVTPKDDAGKVPAPRSTTDTTSIAKEEREIGHVSFTVYLSWAKAAGGAHVFVAIIAAFSCVEAVSVLSKWWLTHWSENGGGHQLRFLAIYAIINLSTILLTLGRLLLVMFAGLRASRTIYVELLHSVLGGKMSFFDQTPLGRIINRFSREMYTVDEELVSTLRSYLNSLMSVISVVFVISSVTPIFTLCLVPIVIFYLHQQNYFTTTYREIKRIDSVSRSPIYALLGETLDGVTTIRAFRVQGLLANRMIKLMDSQQNAYYLTCTAQCWLAVRLELAGTLIIFFACLSAVLQHLSQAGNEKFAGLAGLSISFALSVTQSLNWTVRMASDLEASFIAVERVNQYTNETTGVPQEASRETNVDANAGSDWPRNGHIVFKGVSLRYRENLPRVLKKIDLDIPPGSKVGVVGRTGSGKSTLVVALLRLVELDEGTIEIDKIETSTLGLKKLRSGIAIIPQDPTLFSGTIRSNLDPFGEHGEARLWSVVDRVGLLSSGGMSSASSVSSFGVLSTDGSDTGIGNNGPATTTGHGVGTSGGIRSLNSPVAEGGSNLSVGQRQLLVIARALLSQCRIVVMDEATASIDASTDARIQQVMRTEFRDATVLTIAHRINTIADSTHILGLADGKVVEFDSPATLLGRENGLYKGLVEAWERENTMAS